MTGKWKVSIILFFSVLLLCLPFVGFTQKGKDKILLLEEQLKAVNILKNTKPDSAYKVVTNLIASAQHNHLPIQEAKGLLIKGVILYNKDDNKTAFSLFELALELFQKGGDQSGMARAYNNLGGASNALNQPEKALAYQEKALAIRIAINDPLLSSSYNMLGNIYLNKGDYPKAIDYYLKGLPISEKNNDKYIRSSLLNNIAQIYWKQNRYAEAFDYTSQCLVLEKEDNDYKGMAGSYNNLAGIRIDQDNMDDGLRYCKEAIAYAEKVGYTKELARAYSQMGEIAFRKRNYKEAVEYSSIALAQRRKIGQDKETILSLVKLGEAYTGMQEYDQAEKICKEGLSLSEKNGFQKNQESFYRILGIIYGRKGEWEKAYTNYVKHGELKDSLFNESNSKIIFELQTKYESAKKQTEISLLNKENSIKELRLENNALEINNNHHIIAQRDQLITINGLQLKNAAQQLENQRLDAEKKNEDIKVLNNRFRIQRLELANRNFLIAMILIIVLTGAVVFYVLYNRYKLKQSTILQEEIFKQQEIANKSVFDGEQKERIRIARDLHDGVGQMLSLVKMNLSSMDEGSPVSDKTMDLVDKTIEEVRNISHNLIPEELNFGIIPALSSLAENINSSGTIAMGLTISPAMRNYTFEKQNELSIYRIVQEVVNNMIKHAGASMIHLSIDQIDHTVIIAIKDNGCGLNEGSIDNSKGIGWKNIMARVHLLDGEINVQSEKLSGTKIEITLPENGR